MIRLIIPSYILKSMVGLLDTPIIYLAKKWQKDGKIPDEPLDISQNQENMTRQQLEIA